MKNLSISIILNFVMIVSGYSQSQWEWVTRYPSGNYASNSYQSEGRVFYMGWPKTFFYTPDGGNSFNVITPYRPITDTQLSGNDRIAFTDSLNGFIIDAEGTFRTTDGGENWSNAFPNNYFYFSLIAFGSKNVGWLYGSPGLHKTTNSGKTWQYINSSSLFEILGTSSCIYALDENNLWICKDFNYDKGGVICFSSDGGKNWIIQDTFIADINNQVYFSDIKVNKSGIGIAIGQIYITSQSPHYIPFILRTSDFGTNWQAIFIDDIFTPKFIVSKNDDSWLILGSNENPQINNRMPVELKSSDSGITWQYKENIFSRSYYYYNEPTTAEYLASKNILLVSGYDGIYRSLDFGDSFVRLSGKNEILIEGFALDYFSTKGTQLAVAVSTGDSLIISEDGGRNWQKRYTKEIGKLTGKVCVADGKIFATINTGLYKSTDTGISWSNIYQGYSGIEKITASSGNNIAFISYIEYSPFLFYTEDGGDNWVKTPFPQFCRDIQMLNGGKIYACGIYSDTISTRGFIYNSENYGHDWHVVDTKYEMLKIISFQIRILSFD